MQALVDTIMARYHKRIRIVMLFPRAFAERLTLEFSVIRKGSVEMPLRRIVIDEQYYSILATNSIRWRN